MVIHGGRLLICLLFGEISRVNLWVAKRLHVTLRALQKQLRAKVEKRQAVIMNMPERNYKKFQNEVKKYLSGAEREAQDKYCALWGNRLAGVRHIRGEIYTKVLPKHICLHF